MTYSKYANETDDQLIYRICKDKDKIGYEVPFTRLFYKFVAPASSDSIFEEIKTLELEETKLMKELFGNA